MIDPILQRFSAPYIERFAGVIEKRGTLLSLAAFLISLAGAALVTRHFVWAGLGVFALGVVLGALSRQPLDFLFAPVRSAAMVFAFALENPERAVSLIFLLLGFSAVAVVRTRLGPGLIGEGEALLLFVLLAFFPSGLVAYGAGILCFVAVGWATRRIG
ncbi:MAG: hypothetical protein P4L57_11475 [Rhizomicrobium sp.]|nr:hypothetical protein [Rhizomicrobium sp.]